MLPLTWWRPLADLAIALAVVLLIVAVPALVYLRGRRLALAHITVSVAFVILVLLGPVLAWAQDPNVAADIAAGVSFACQHQDWIVYVLVFLALHFGCSGVSAIAKKLGIGGPLVAVIRMIAMDVKPPDATVLAHAAEIQAQQK